MRNAVNQAKTAATTAGDTSADLGASASGIGSSVTPFLTEEMLHPSGVGQTGIAAEEAAGLGSSGGGASALTGQAVQRAAASRNAGGYQAALSDVARQRMKTDAGTSEGIAAGDEALKQQQSQEGASGLEKLYGVDTSGMLESQGQQAGDINAQVNAGNSGWLQNTMNIIKTLSGAAKGGG